MSKYHKYTPRFLLITASSTGGNFASSNDMAKIGRSILRSTVLPPTVTRHWLRPDTFSEFFAQGVGKPWEIFRVKINGASVEIYSKLGDCKFSSCPKGAFQWASRGDQPD